MDLWQEALKHFEETTSGSTVIMGRNTFESIIAILGKPLPNRNSIVISRTMNPTDGIDVCKSIKEALKKAEDYDAKVFCIGGANLYAQMLPMADKMIITYVKGDFEGDAYFPEFDESAWDIDKKDEFPDYSIVYYSRTENSQSQGI